MTFSDPIVGGNNEIIRDNMHSRGYVPGVAGWQIKRDGDAEFNSVTVRGALDVGDATQYVRIHIEPPTSPSPGPVIALNANAAAYPIDGFIQGSVFGGGSITARSPYDPGSANLPASLDLVSGPTGADPISGRAARIGGGLYVNGNVMVEPSAGNAVFQTTDTGATVRGNLSVTGIGQRRTVATDIDQSVENSTALVNSALSLSVVSGARYRGTATVWYTATFGNDLDYSWTMPAGTVGKRGTFAPDTSSALGNVVVMNDRVSGGFNTRFSCGGSNGIFRQFREEMVFTAGADGPVTLQFAQRAAGGAGTTAVILSHSYFELERFA